MKPLLLDLFACEGVGGSGYAAAGFDVFAVDTDAEALSRNPYRSFHGDALKVLGRLIAGESLDFRYHDGYRVRLRLENVGAVHASPPCQGYTSMSNRWRGQGGAADDWPKLIGPVRDLLIASGKPWVLENVVAARSEMVNPVLLHGGMFGLGVDRPRLFDSNVMLMKPPDAPRCQSPVGVYGKLDGRRLFTRSDGTEQRAAASVGEAQAAMGGPLWASWRGLCEAIPPAYTSFIGEQLRTSVQVAA